MNANLYALLASRFPADRHACAIESGPGRYYTWNDLEHGTAKIANLLRALGLAPGDRVAAQVDKSPEALMLYLATIRAGYVYLPLNTAYRADEIAYFLQDATPSVVVCTAGNFGWVAQVAFRSGTRHVFTLAEAPEGKMGGSLLSRAAHCASEFETVSIRPNDLAVLLYTSGTTGRSKGAMLTHGNLSSNALVLQQAWEWTSDDVLLHALPLFHIHGLFVACNGALLAGSKMIFLPRFDAGKALALLSRATMFMGVPTYYLRLLDEPALTEPACRAMRLFISGSAPLLAETFERFRQRTGHFILERYGMSETGMMASNPCRGARRAATVGFALPGVSLRVTNTDGHAGAVGDVVDIGDVGEIQVKGSNVFAGYWNMPEKTAADFTVDGYFKTGDLGSLDVDGYLSIVGRGKDMIISGGYNVYPKEIEMLIDDLPGVQESAVIGLPHRDFGEAVAAIVVPRSGAVLSEEEILAVLKPRIANFKLPKRIFLVNELPRNAMGKVQKNLLREKFAL